MSKHDKTEAEVASGTDRLRNTSNVLKKALITAHETEEVGKHTMVKLEEQRITIEHSQNTVSQVDSSLHGAQRNLTHMSRRAMTNKLLMICVILLIIVGIMLLIYLRWFKFFAYVHKQK